MGASSRPFLNLLNPMGRHYRGYQRANDVVEEEEEEDYEEDENAANDNDNANEGRSKRSVSWGRPGTSSERHVLQTRRDLTRHAGDTDGEEEDDDGEVPQSFLIEAAGRRPSLSSKGLPPRVSPSKPPKNPTHLAVPNHPLPFKLPSRPSELEPPPLELPTHNNMAQQPMRGLDAYERALWNWVNVSNLDAYLQEVRDVFQVDVVLIYRSSSQTGLRILRRKRHILYRIITWPQPTVRRSSREARLLKKSNLVF
jgi:autophagy-related protein 9